MMHFLQQPSAMLNSALLALTIGALNNALIAVATGDFGPDTCLQSEISCFSSHICVFTNQRQILGWVWREAYANDHVCVTVETRSQAATDNALAASRRDRNGGPFGPDTCIQGFVWREANPTDYVCVTPATR